MHWFVLCSFFVLVRWGEEVHDIGVKALPQWLGGFRASDEQCQGFTRRHKPVERAFAGGERAEKMRRPPALPLTNQQ